LARPARGSFGGAPVFGAKAKADGPGGQAAQPWEPLEETQRGGYFWRSFGSDGGNQYDPVGQHLRALDHASRPVAAFLDGGEGVIRHGALAGQRAKNAG